jgi:DNA-binding response OmpR family regulator
MLLIAVTERERDADFMAALDAGFDGHVVKPLTPEALDAVAGRVRRRAVRDAEAGA